MRGSYDDVQEIADDMDTHPQVISLDPRTVGEMLGDVRTLAQATDSKDAAVDLMREASARIDRVRLAVRGAPGRGSPRSNGSTRRSRRGTGPRS